MWIMSFIPDSLLIWMINIILIAGVLGTVAGFFIKFIPLVSTYRLPIQIISVILLATGLYLKGGYSVEMKWRERVAELEAKIKESESKSKGVNVVVRNKVVKQIEYVDQVREVIKEVIKDNTIIINAECTVSPVAIDILNAAARNEKLEAKK